MRFTEEKLEQAFIELLGNEYFPHHFGINIKRAVDEVLIEEDLINYLLTKYQNKGITKVIKRLCVYFRMVLY